MKKFGNNLNMNRKKGVNHAKHWAPDNLHSKNVCASKFQIKLQFTCGSYNVTKLCIASHVGWLHFVRSFPNFAQTDGAVKSIENGQWHGYMSDYGPSPKSIKVQLNWMAFSSWFFQCANGPHGKIGNQQECDDLSTRFLAHMLGCCCIPSARIQYEHRLDGRLNDWRQGCDKYENCI